MCYDDSKKNSNREQCSTAPDCQSSMPYTLRRSAKARRVSLRVLPGKGLEVVLPQWADASIVPEVLERHNAWIRRALARMRSDDTAVPEAVPPLLVLKGGAEALHVFVDGETPRDAPGVGRWTASERGPAEAAEKKLAPGALRRELLLPRGDVRANLLHLREWLREEARDFLGRKLDALCREHGLTYSSLSVRFQKSRWGSCSIRQRISLNAGLLFLPDQLSTYILRHELCHTRHMNHSDAFWKLLFSLDPEALAHDRAMRRAWRHIPLWLYNIK